jgi:hypothetical protein
MSSSMPFNVTVASDRRLRELQTVPHPAHRPTRRLELQTLGFIAHLGNFSTAPGVAHQNQGAVLQRDDSPGRPSIVSQRGQWVLTETTE